MKTAQISDNRWLIFDDPRLLDWCAKHIDSVQSAEGWHLERAQGLGLAVGDDIVACMVVHDFSSTRRTCQISFAATTARWATRDTIAEMMAYPFAMLGCNRITTLIASKNTRAIKFNLGLGFKKEGLCRKGFGDDDAVVLGLLREEAPAWMRVATPPKIVHKP